jgi:hypothetical protein
MIGRDLSPKLIMMCQPNSKLFCKTIVEFAIKVFTKDCRMT